MNQKILKTIEISLMIGLCLGVVSAIYAGECIEVDLSILDNNEDILYMVVGNTSNTDGLTVSFNSETQNASICTIVDYKPDIFTIVFFNKEKDIGVEYKSRGSSKTVYVENKTTEYVDVPTYIDREIIVGNDTTIIVQDEPSIIDEIPWTFWSWWYWYLMILLTLTLIIYLWMKSFGEKEETNEEVEELITTIK